MHLIACTYLATYKCTLVANKSDIWDNTTGIRIAAPRFIASQFQLCSHSALLQISHMEHFCIVIWHVIANSVCIICEPRKKCSFLGCVFCFWVASISLLIDAMVAPFFSIAGTLPLGRNCSRLVVHQWTDFAPVYQLIFSVRTRSWRALICEKPWFQKIRLLSLSWLFRILEG